MTKKIWLPMLALIALVLLISGCGGDDDDDGGETSTETEGEDAEGQPDVSETTAENGDGEEQAAGACPIDALAAADGPVELTFWHAMNAANEETLNTLIEEFNSSQDAVRVNAVFQGTYAELLDKYLTALRSGSDLPDIVQIEDTAQRLMIDSQSTLAVQDCIDAEGYDTSDYLDRVLAYYTVEDRLWPMPFNVSSPILLYNRSDFADAGLDPDAPPQTLDEVREFSQEIVDSGAAAHGFSLDLSPWYIEQLFGLAGEEFVNNQNGRAERATELTIDNEVGLDIFTFIKEMVDEGLAESVGRNPGGADQLLAVGAGSSAMTIATSASLGSVFDILESGQFPGVDPGVGRMPAVGDGEGGILVGGAALWIVNRSSEEEQAAAWEFAKFLTQPETQAAWHAGTGYIPIRESAVELSQVQDLWAERPQFRVAYEQLLAGTTNGASAGPVLGAYAEVREVVVRAMELMILEGLDPQEALTQAEAEATSALEDYNDRVG